MPPNLDIPHIIPPPPQKSRFRCILENFAGPACLIDPQGTIEAANSSWSELAQKAGRPELSSEQLMGCVLGNLLPDEEQKTALHNAIAVMKAGGQSSFQQVVELGLNGKPCAVNLHAQPIQDDDGFTGFLVQCSDATTEHISRLALLDRERRLREVRAAFEKQNEELAALRKTAEQSAALQAAFDHLNEELSSLRSSSGQAEELRTLLEQKNEELDALRKTSEQVNAMQISLEQQSEELTALRTFAEKANALQTSFEKQHDELTALKTQMENAGAGRDHVVKSLLSVFQTEFENFDSAFCRLGAETGGAMFATLALYESEIEKLHFAAEHNAPDYHRFMVESGCVELAIGEGPAGIAAQNGCPTMFDHLKTRDDFAPWAPLAAQYGYNCIWAFPIEDESGLFGVLQLYYAADEIAIPVDAYSLLTALCHFAAPLLRTCSAQKQKEIPKAERAPQTSGIRVLAAGLADEFANLLTGVLGHSSLIEAEMGEGHAALDDVRAIEKSARSAAKLTRRLTALCGNVHHGTAPLELASYLKTYATRDRANYFPQGTAALDLCEGKCTVLLESPSLEVILDGMADHARNYDMGESAPRWQLQITESHAVIRLTYAGQASLPGEWLSESLSPHVRGQISELVFAREAARAVGGEMAVEENGDSVMLTLKIPLAPQPAAREPS